MQAQRIVPPPFDPAEFGFRLKPDFDRRVLRRLIVSLVGQARTREERLFVTKLDWDLHRKPVRIDRSTFHVLRDWCSDTEPARRLRRSMALQVWQACLANIHPAKPARSQENAMHQKKRKDKAKAKLKKRYSEEKWPRWIILAGLPDTNRRRH